MFAVDQQRQQQQPAADSYSSNVEQELDRTLVETERSTSALINTFASTSAQQQAAVRDSVTRIQAAFGQLRKQMRDLELLAEEQDTADDSERVAARWKHHKLEYERLQQDFRKASLQVRRNAEQAAVEERRALLSSPDPTKRQQKLQGEAGLLGTAEEVTESMQRTRQLLAQELEHTGTTLAALDSSHTRLRRAKDEFQQQTPLFAASKKLLGTMRWHSMLDTLTLWGSFAVFCLVVVYILQKRLLYFVPASLMPSSLLPFSLWGAVKNSTAGAVGIAAGLSKPHIHRAQPHPAEVPRRWTDEQLNEMVAPEESSEWVQQHNPKLEAIFARQQQLEELEQQQRAQQQRTHQPDSGDEEQFFDAQDHQPGTDSPVSVDHAEQREHGSSHQQETQQPEQRAHVDPHPAVKPWSDSRLSEMLKSGKLPDLPGIRKSASLEDAQAIQAALLQQAQQAQQAMAGQAYPGQPGLAQQMQQAQQQLAQQTEQEVPDQEPAASLLMHPTRPDEQLVDQAASSDQQPEAEASEHAAAGKRHPEEAEAVDASGKESDASEGSSVFAEDQPLLQQHVVTEPTSADAPEAPEAEAADAVPASLEGSSVAAEHQRLLLQHKVPEGQYSPAHPEGSQSAAGIPSAQHGMDDEEAEEEDGQVESEEGPGGAEHPNSADSDAEGAGNDGAANNDDEGFPEGQQGDDEGEPEAASASPPPGGHSLGFEAVEDEDGGSADGAKPGSDQAGSALDPTRHSASEGAGFEAAEDDADRGSGHWLDEDGQVITGPDSAGGHAPQSAAPVKQAAPAHPASAGDAEDADEQEGGQLAAKQPAHHDLHLQDHADSEQAQLSANVERRGDWGDLQPHKQGHANVSGASAEEALLAALSAEAPTASRMSDQTELDEPSLDYQDDYEYPGVVRQKDGNMSHMPEVDSQSKRDEL